MKRLSTLFVMMLVGMNIHAQSIKILFDATKAETAGNADWIVDADVNNVYWNNSGSYSLTGSESNAQQIPTPAQSGITSGTAESFWTGGISAWGIDMVKKGYVVETLPCNGQITYGNTGNTQDLSNYKVFIVVEPNIWFTAAEKTAMMNFVQNGGGLFMVADHAGADRNNDGADPPKIWNDFMDTNTVHPFGIHFDYVSVSQTTSNVASLPGDPLLHGIMGDVTQVMWSAGNTMTISTTNNPSVKGVVYKTGSSTTGSTNAIVAYATYGSGRVVGFGDSSPCDDGSGDSGDVLYDGWITDASGNHQKLIVNATIWLAGNPTTSINDGVSPKLLVNQLTFPDKTEFVVSSSETLKNASFCMYDIVGNLLYQTSEVNDVILMNNKFGSGMYIYKIIAEGAILKTGKFFIP
jgi:hypothetical protein